MKSTTVANPVLMVMPMGKAVGTVAVDAPKITRPALLLLLWAGLYAGLSEFVEIVLA
jgi:hypothetical protein